jgi:hypothetical protein
MIPCMSGNRPRGQLIDLAPIRRRRLAEALIEARGRMIEVEITLFVALWLAGYRNRSARATARRLRAWRNKLSGPPPSSGPLATVLPFVSGKRAA